MNQMNPYGGGTNCRNCGTPIAPGTDMCPQCGTFQGQPVAPYPPPGYQQPGYPPPGYQYGGVMPKQRLVYILLGIFLGSFGVHNFYAGYTGRAIGQLITFVVSFILCFIFIGFIGLVGLFVWVIIDIITITQDAQGVPFV